MKAVELLRIGNLFDSLHWPTHVDEDGPIPYLFDRFARMWDRLDDEERDLLFELTGSYLWVRYEHRPAHFNAAWRKMISQLPPNVKIVAVAPLLKPGDQQPKSSGSIYYDFVEGHRDKLSNDLAPRKLHVFKSVYDFSSRHAVAPDVALIFVDDYVGSGSTAGAVLGEIPGANAMFIALLALVAQKAAIAELAAKSCLLVADRFLDRGITDSRTLPNIGRALDVMTQLSTKLRIKKRDLLGYRGAEALVTLIRTPNNTFPVYWTNNKLGDAVWTSPFTRYTHNED